MDATTAMTPSGVTPAARAWARFRRHRPAVTSCVVLAMLLLLVLTSGQWWHASPESLTPDIFAPPSARHWLGTDANGRDVLARLCAGARISLVVGVAGAAVSLAVGVGVGALAGYAGGRIDSVLMRGVDILYSLPSVVLVIVLITACQEGVNGLVQAIGIRDSAGWSSMAMVVLGLGAVSWLTMARIVRAQVISLRHQPFVEASRALGASHARILFRHILPNSLGVVIAYLTLTLPTVILGESFLSFLGLGIQPPQASLGSLIAEGAGQINPIRTYWWLLAGPAGLMVVLLVTVGFMGDGLRDAWDPRRRDR